MNVSINGNKFQQNPRKTPGILGKILENQAEFTEKIHEFQKKSKNSAKNLGIPGKNPSKIGRIPGKYPGIQRKIQEFWKNPGIPVGSR